MTRDDGDRARLAEIERLLAREAPDLADALRCWHRPRRWLTPWTGTAAGIVLAVLAFLVGGPGLVVALGWLAAASLCWCWVARVAFGQARPDRSGPGRPPVW